MVNPAHIWPYLRMKGSMDMVQVLGLVAGACTSTAALPQLVKAWKTKEVKDVSAKMFILYVLGNSLWLIYGLIRSDMPIVVTNAIAVTFQGMMLFLKIKYRNNTGATNASTI